MNKAMRLRRFIVFTFLWSTMACGAWAAVVTGKITDAQGDPLPFASILIKGSTMGTSANANGVYRIELQPGHYQIIGHFIGFVQSVFDITLSGNETITHDFALKDQGYELSNVVVHASAEDPAYRVIRNAIKRRSFHLNQMHSFQTSIYVKGVMRNRVLPDKIMGVRLKESDKKDMGGSMGLDTSGKGVLYLCEEMADYYAAGDGKEKVIIRSVKESGDPNGVGLGSVPSVINFYENNVKTLVVNNGNTQGFISPISNNALSYYKYKLQGEFKENDVTIYKIKVTPKRLYERCFQGDIYIVDDIWAIHSLNLLATKTSGLDVLDTISTQQQYIPTDKDVWVIKSQIIYPTIGIMGFDITGSFVSVYDDQKVNVSIPDSIFDKKVRVSYDQDATKKDSTYWQSQRMMKLENDEQRNYIFKDSVRIVNEDPHRIDSIRRRNNKVSVSKIILGGLKFNSRAYKNTYTISPIIYDVNFNTVEGLNYSPCLGWKHTIDSQRKLELGSNVRYGFSNKHFNAKASIIYQVNDRKWTGRYWWVGLSGGKYISQFNGTQPVPELFNTESSLLLRDNFFKIYERSFISAVVNKNYGNGWTWKAGMSYQQRLPLENTTDYTWANKSKTDAYTPNVPTELAAANWEKHNAMLVNASVSFSPGYTYTQYPDRKEAYPGNWPIFTLNYQKGIPNILNSKTDFDKWSFKVKDDLNLKLLGSLAYTLSVGGFLNDKYVSIPDMMHLNGNQYLITSSYANSFQLAHYYRYSNTAKLYGEAHVEYHMKGLLTNKIPLLRQAHWYFVVGNNTFYANANQYYTEAFIGIDNLGFKIFRFLRLDYVHAWDAENRNYSGFRLGINPNGILKLNLKDTKASEF
jgi:hypothetical protein